MVGLARLDVALGQRPDQPTAPTPPKTKADLFRAIDGGRPLTDFLVQKERPRMNEAALLQHYTAVADQSDIPILIYNVTKFTHISVSVGVRVSVSVSVSVGCGSTLTARGAAAGGLDPSRGFSIIPIAWRS